jgi:hypothetical protein
VLNVSRPVNYDGQANQGMLNAHYINDGQASNVVDAGVPACVNNQPPVPTAAPVVTLAQGPAAPAGYRYAITLSGFSANAGVSVTCYDSVSPAGFYTFNLTTDGSGTAFTQSYCYSGDGPDHWVVAGGVQSNQVSWGGPSNGGGGGGTVGHTIINGVDVGIPYNDPHEWGVGGCIVQDFSNGPFGHVIVDFTNGTHVVRSGMLAGWLAVGGGPGYGCPLNDEYAYGAGRMQDFGGGTIGSGPLYWVPGEIASLPFVSPCLFPMRWNKLHLTYSYSGAHRYLGNAIAAARNWSATPAGITITAAPAGTRPDIIFYDTYDRTADFLAHTNVPADWALQTTTLNTQWHVPFQMSIRVNQYQMDQRGVGDFARTFALTHELGHALGLAHSDLCGGQPRSIMHSGFKGQFDQGFNTPQRYDISELEELYGRPVQ